MGFFYLHKIIIISPGYKVHTVRTRSFATDYVPARAIKAREELSKP